MQQLRVTAYNSYGLQHATVTGYTMKHTAYSYRSQQVAALFTLSFGSQHAAALVTIQSTQRLVGMSHRSHRFLAGHSSFPTIIQTSEEFSGGPASILHASFWLSSLEQRSFANSLRFYAHICMKTIEKKHMNTVVENSQEYRLEYWATRSSVRSFTRTAHLFACSGLLASLAPSAALTRLLARSLCSLPRW